MDKQDLWDQLGTVATPLREGITQLVKSAPRPRPFWFLLLALIICFCLPAIVLAILIYAQSVPALAWAGLFLGGMSATLLLSLVRRSSLKVDSLTIRDSEGRARIFLGMDKEGDPSIAIHDSTGAIRCLLWASEDMVQLVMSGDGNKADVILHGDTKGRRTLTLRGGRESRLRMMATETATQISALTKDQKKVLTWGWSESGQPFPSEPFDVRGRDATESESPDDDGAHQAADRQAED